MAVKKTSEWVPLCHGIGVGGAVVRVEAVGAATATTTGENETSSSDDGAGVDGGVCEEGGDWTGERDLGEEFLKAPLGAFGGVRVLVRVSCWGRTGVEMEALTGVVGAALTVVDMCKGVDRGLGVGGVRVVGKAGGRSGDWGWGVEGVGEGERNGEERV